MCLVNSLCQPSKSPVFKSILQHRSKAVSRLHSSITTGHVEVKNKARRKWEK
ncbi:hypothetical protein CIPAW_12G065400 [Carya illinoinensis]|uniref:Uncharacterized protein n=1 Tax=Carya illinoinensis TaxID=32201 RepID=A0A8T1NWS5_CARIL|nr:hypothetical protein CIPAW_12G065400 [Carya illinoinensis]